MRFIIILTLLLSQSILAASLPGRVVRVVDGDTLVVIDSNKAQHKIQLAGIDAPELQQSFGMESREYLSQQVLGRFVVIEYDKRDDYNLVTGKLLLNNADVNLEMISAGLARHSRMHAQDQTESERLLYKEAEEEARRARRGLWFDANPIPPWEYRNR
jgi:endonuclease YncB( thermonuclease family)